MQPCLAPNIVEDLVGGRIHPAAAQPIVAHLNQCQVCRAVVAAATANSRETKAMTQTLPLAQCPPTPTTTRLGRFSIRRPIGQGGMGVVFEAVDEERGATVALKTLNRSDGASLARFKREFRALQGIAHPNLVALDELFVVNEQWFFTMELVDGIDFVSHVRPAASGGFDEPRLRADLRQLIDGLAALHAAGKVHRDVKPSNVLVTPAGRLVLLDFGLVTEAAADVGSTGSAVVGTPLYMAPEQAASREVGPAADLYSVGVMLYEALTGTLPHKGPLLQLLVEKQTHEPPAPSAITSDVPKDLDALCGKLLRFDPAQRPSTDEVARALLRAQISATARPSSSQPPPFVGRRDELGALHTAFTASARETLSAILICGESGIGKSYLVRRFTSELLAVQPDTMILEGRCYERETVPYKTIDGIVDALSRRLSRMPAGEIAALLPARVDALAQVFPVMLRIPQIAREHVARPKLVEPHELRQRAFLALRDLLTRLAVRRPTVMAIDDFQWADDDGLRALAEILRPPDPPPLMLLGTVRPGSDGTESALARLRDAIPGDVRVIELLRLQHDQARDLAAALCARAAVHDADADRIATESGGHPLFLEELTRHVALGGSAHDEVKLDDAIWARVAQLEGATREMAELVAVAGKPLPQQIIAAAAHVEPTEFNRRTASLRAANIVRTGGARWADAIEPYHDRVREAVLAQLDPARRRVLHEALAVAFETSATRDAEALAVHWREASDERRAASYAAIAGDQASSTFAFDRAARWYEQALELLPPGDTTTRDLRIKLGDALANAGRGALAAPHFQAVAVEATPIEALELKRRAAEQLLRCGHIDEGLAVSSSVLGAMGMRLPTTRWGNLLLIIYYQLRIMLRGLEFREREKGQITAEELTRLDTCWSIGSTLGFIDSSIGVLFLMRALLLALATGDLERITRGLGLHIAVSAVRGHRSWRRTAELIRYSDGLAARCGTSAARLYALLGHGTALTLNGRFLEAAEHLDGALALLEDDTLGASTWERVTARSVLVQTLINLGRFKAARRIVQVGLRDAAARGDIHASVSFKVGEAAFVWLAEDRPDLAEAHARAAWVDLSSTVFDVKHVMALDAHAHARLYVGDAAQAYALANEALQRSRRSLTWRVLIWRLVVTRSRALMALAMVASGLGDRRALLRQIARDAKAIESEGGAMSGSFAATLRAGIALHTGARAEAIAQLTAAAAEFDAAARALIPAAHDRVARLRGDAASAAELERAAERLRSEDVVAPERMIAILMPGLAAPDRS
jgi:serine/threonine protein kinase/tetratricopeptide (TPR) repeat protein